MKTKKMSLLFCSSNLPISNVFGLCNKLYVMADREDIKLEKNLESYMQHSTAA